MKISFNCTDDQQVVHTHKDAGLSDQVPCSKPDISPEAYLNDYRNRMPFHYIEEGSDGYYYWQYGSIMDLVINFVDEIAQSEDMPEAVLDVRINDKSVVDPVAGIAHLGSMALHRAEDYYTLKQTDKIVGTLSRQIRDLQEGAIASIVDAPDNLMSGQLLMWDSEARRLIGSPLVAGDAEKSLILKTSSSDPNFASHEGAVLLGRGLRSSFPYQVLVGHYNQIDPDAIFAVGSGFSKLAPLTAFSVSREGQVLVSSSPVSEKGVVRLKELSSLRINLTSILNRKLDRVEEVSEYPQAYVKLSDGTQAMYSISFEPVARTVSLRDDYGNLQTNSPRYAKDSANKEYVDSKFESDAIFDKDLTVKGSLTVAGTSTVIDSESLSVKDNFILTNSNRVSLIDLSGIVINKDNVSAYGIVLDPADELLKLGLGKVDENGKFNFLPGQAQVLATREYVDNLNLENGEGEGSLQQKGGIKAEANWSVALGKVVSKTVKNTSVGDDLYLYNQLVKFGIYTPDANSSISLLYDGIKSENATSSFALSANILEACSVANTAFQYQHIAKGLLNFSAGGLDNVTIGLGNFTTGYMNFNVGYFNAIFGAKNTIDFHDGTSINDDWNGWGMAHQSGNYNLIAGFEHYLKQSSQMFVIGRGHKITNSNDAAVIGDSLTADELSRGLLIGCGNPNVATQLGNKNYLEIVGKYNDGRIGTLYFTNQRGVVGIGYMHAPSDSWYSLLVGTRNINGGKTCNNTALIGHDLKSTRSDQLIVGYNNDKADTTSLFAVAADGINVFKVRDTGQVITGRSTSDTDEDLTLVTKDYLQRKINAVKPGSGGSVINDVTSLPTENINRNAFYRVREKIAILNGSNYFMGVPLFVKTVETLPTVGENAAFDGSDAISLYHQTSDGVVYVYTDDNGWVPVELALSQLGYSYGGIVNSRDEATGSNTLYITYGDYVIYSYTDKWNILNETKNGVNTAYFSSFESLFSWLKANYKIKNILKIGCGHHDISNFSTQMLLQNPTFYDHYIGGLNNDHELKGAKFTIWDSGWLYDENSNLYREICELAMVDESGLFGYKYTGLRYQGDDSGNITIKEDSSVANDHYGADETCFVTYTDNNDYIDPKGN